MDRFLKREDYIGIIDSASLEAAERADADRRTRCEDAAIDMMKGYLRNRFDVDDVFAKRGDDRSKMLVSVAVDISLYDLYSALPGKMGMEIRQTRYDNAIAWLKSVQAGIVALDLTATSKIAGTDLFGSDDKSGFSW
jgi:phage gp36-like protein